MDSSNVLRNREVVNQKLLCVIDWCRQELYEVFVAFSILVNGLAPCRNCLTREDENVEECIEEKDDVGLDRYTVKQHGLRWNGESVRHQRRLDHDQAVVDVHLVQDMSIECGLIGAVVEHLQEL